MLPKNRRLTSAEVTLVLKSGKSVSAGPLRLKYTKRTEKTLLSRFAIVISKKVLKSAVDRSHLRRQAFSLLRDTKPPFPINGAIFITTPIKFADLKERLTTIFIQMHVGRR